MEICGGFVVFWGRVNYFWQGFVKVLGNCTNDGVDLYNLTRSRNFR
jgi:hypothetical protein